MTDSSLIPLIRKFDGFEKALTAQLAAFPGFDVRFEVEEIGDLQRHVLGGGAASSLEEWAMQTHLPALVRVAVPHGAGA